MAVTDEDLIEPSLSLFGGITESRINYWAAYVTDFSCPFLFGYLGSRHPIGWPGTVTLFALGLVVFSLAEYSIHRWLLHHPRSPLFSLHSAHHKTPESTAAFFFPTSMIVLMSAWALLWLGLHLPGVSFFLCGFATGYCYFGALHHIEHTTRINQIPFRWLQHRWAAHSVHHRLDEKNFGVTTSFWDYAFRTKHKYKKRLIEPRF